MRKPLAVANWKMAMTVGEGLTFLQEFQAAIGELARAVDIVICPPYTALYPMAQALEDASAPISLGAQDVHWASDPAFTGEISARLLADVGCQWVLLGHWERRRQRGEDDELVNRKLHAALAGGLRPILLVGQARGEADRFRLPLATQLSRLLAGCDAVQVARMAFVFEPEWSIGVAEPAPPDQVGAGCRFVRQWLAGEYGAAAADALRIIYGGSVTPAHAAALLAQPDVDGLGASRKGREAAAFAAIVRLIAQCRGNPCGCPPGQG